MEVYVLLLKQGIVLFWALWVSIAWLSNLCDGLKACHLLGTGWRFASGNYTFMVETTQKYHTPRWLTALMFAGVLIWPGGATLHTAFLVNLALWAALLSLLLGIVARGELILAVLTPQYLAAWGLEQPHRTGATGEQ